MSVSESYNLNESSRSTVDRLKLKSDKKKEQKIDMRLYSIKVD